MKSRKWWALVPAVLVVLTVGLDATILSVALPTLGRSLHASTGQLQWFVAAYTLVFAAALVPGGMLGDRYGRKKMLVISLLAFGAASIACALAPSAEAFIAARALLGLGGAIMLPWCSASSRCSSTKRSGHGRSRRSWPPRCSAIRSARSSAAGCSRGSTGAGSS
jgi:MFS family permease